MPLSADLQTLQNKFSIKNNVGRTTESDFWSSFDSLQNLGVCWPLGIFVWPDGVGLQLYFHPSHDEFHLFVETSKGHALLEKMKEEFRAKN